MSITATASTDQQHFQESFANMAHSMSGVTVTFGIIMVAVAWILVWFNVRALVVHGGSGDMVANVMNVMLSFLGSAFILMGTGSFNAMLAISWIATGVTLAALGLIEVALVTHRGIAAARRKRTSPGGKA